MVAFPPFDRIKYQINLNEGIQMPEILRINHTLRMETSLWNLNA